MESRNYGQNGAGPSSSVWNSSQHQQTEAARLVEQSYQSGLLEGQPLVVKKRFSKLRPVGGELVREHGHHCLLYEFNQNKDLHEAHGNIQRVYGTNAPRMTQCQTVYEEFKKRMGVAKESNEELSAPSPAAPKRKRPNMDYGRLAKKEKKLRKMEKIRAAQLAKKMKRAEMKAMGKAGDGEEAGQKVEEKEEQEEQPENENLRNVRIQTESTFSNLGHWLRPPKEPKKQEEDEAVTVTKTKNYNYLIMVRKALAERGEGANLYEIIGHVLMHGPMPDGTSKKVILDSTLNALSRLQMQSTRLAVEEKEASKFKAERPSTSTSNNPRPNVLPSTPNTGNELVDFILNQANLEISMKEEEAEGEEEEMQGT